MNMQNTDDQDELFDLVNENDEVISLVRRQEANQNPKLYHRSAVVFVYNNQGELFLQKRSLTKDVAPGTWTISAAGHLLQGQSYSEAARRELMEELGVTAKLKFLKKLLVSVENEIEINAIFTTVHNGPFKLHPQEIETGKFFRLSAIEEEIINGQVPVSEWTKTQLYTNCGILQKLPYLKKYIRKVFPYERKSFC